MKIFIFAYDRFDTMTTSLAVGGDGVQHYVLCHSESDKQRFIDSGTISDKAEIIATANPKGLTRQRNFALDMLKDGEWAMFMNDDFERLRIFSDYYSDKQELLPQDVKNSCWQNSMTFREFVEEADRLSMRFKGTNLIGFATNSNPNNLRRRYTLSHLIDGRCYLIRKTSIRYDTRFNVLEDHYISAENIVRYGNTVRCNWIVPEFSRFTNGGFGDIANRTPLLREEAKLLAEKYPFLLELKDKRGFDAGCQLRFRRLDIYDNINRYK